MSIQVLNKNAELVNKVRMCDLKIGQLAVTMSEDPDIVLCVGFMEEKVFLVLNDSAKQETYRGVCSLLVEALPPGYTIDVRFSQNGY